MLRIFSKYNFEVLEYKMDDGLFWIPKINIFGRSFFLAVERLFKNFKRNPLSCSMLFVAKKNSYA
jgi:hypothetical protein